MQLDLLFPIYVKDVVHNQTLIGSFKVGGEQAYGIILAFNGLLVALLTVAVTKWMTKYQERNVFVLSSVMYAMAIPVFRADQLDLGTANSNGTVYLRRINGGRSSASFISRISPEHMRGQYFAAASLRYTFGKTIAPIHSLTVWVGYEWTFFILCLLALLSSFLYWMMFAVLQKVSLKDKTI